MSESQLSNANLVLEILSFGKIEFLDLVDLSNIIDLDAYSELQNGMAGIDTNIFSSLKNKKARVTFYGLIFSKTPTIYYDFSFNLNSTSNNICPGTICSNITYSNGILSFDVSSFSTFLAGETRTCFQQSGFICRENEICKGNLLEARDTNSCCSVKCSPNFRNLKVCSSPDSKIEINIKDPDENDDFRLDEIIEGKAEIRNNFDDDKDFKYEISLYDLKNNDKTISEKNDIDIDSSDREKIDFQFKLAEIEDLDEEEYYIYMNVYDEDNKSLCNEEYFPIEIEKEDYALKILKIPLPEEINCQDSFESKIKLKNIGEEDLEDIYISVSGLDEIKSDKFDLDKNDETEKALQLNADVNETGNYSLGFNIYFEGMKISQNKEVNVLCEKIDYISIEEETFPKISLNKLTSRVVLKLDKEKKLLLVNISLLAGIIIIIIGIFVARKINKARKDL